MTKPKRAIRRAKHRTDPAATRTLAALTGEIPSAMPEDCNSILTSQSSAPRVVSGMNNTEQIDQLLACQRELNELDRDVTKLEKIMAKYDAEEQAFYQIVDRVFAEHHAHQTAVDLPLPGIALSSE